MEGDALEGMKVYIHTFNYVTENLFVIHIQIMRVFQL